jgi:hypothetical protein
LLFPEALLGQHGKLPLVVGVTGHRDLRPADVERLREEVEKIFARLEADYPHTPLIVLSALAEGADRLVAEVGLSRQARLIAPLPMPMDDYLHDFKTAESRAEFQRFLDQGTGFAVPFELDQRVAGTPLTLEQREHSYAAGGAYIAINSDVLIALWNGDAPDRIGGTGCIVEYKLTGVPVPYGPPTNPLDVIESGPVYHIVTPRLRDEKPPPKALTCKILHPSFWGGEAMDAQANAFYAEIYKRIDEFNADMLRAPFTPDAHASEPVQLHTIADALALRFRRFARGTLLAIFLLAGGSAVAFAVYAHLAHSRWWLLADVVGFATATIFYLYGLRARFDKRYQDYRALAEGLRVQMYWREAGIDAAVAAHYLRKQKSELDWIRDAIRSSRVLADGEPAEAATRRAAGHGLAHVHERWVVGQRNWFDDAVKAEQHLEHDWNRFALGIFVVGLLVAAVVVVSLVIHGTELEEHDRDYLIAFLALTGVIGGLIHGYVEKRAWAQHVKQYYRMKVAFTNADVALRPLVDDPTPENEQRARHLLYELGREALIENADWLLLHRDRRIDVPFSG